MLVIVAAGTERKRGHKMSDHIGWGEKSRGWRELVSDVMKLCRHKIENESRVHKMILDRSSKAKQMEKSDKETQASKSTKDKNALEAEMKEKMWNAWNKLIWTFKTERKCFWWAYNLNTIQRKTFFCNRETTIGSTTDTSAFKLQNILNRIWELYLHCGFSQYYGQVCSAFHCFKLSYPQYNFFFFLVLESVYCNTIFLNFVIFPNNLGPICSFQQSLFLARSK